MKVFFHTNFAVHFISEGALWEAAKLWWDEIRTIGIPDLGLSLDTVKTGIGHWTQVRK